MVVTVKEYPYKAVFDGQTIRLWKETKIDIFALSSNVYLIDKSLDTIEAWQ